MGELRSREGGGPARDGPWGPGAGAAPRPRVHCPPLLTLLTCRLVALLPEPAVMRAVMVVVALRLL